MHAKDQKVAMYLYSKMANEGVHCNLWWSTNLKIILLKNDKSNRGACIWQFQSYIRTKCEYTLENVSPLIIESINWIAVMAPTTAPIPAPRASPVSVVCPLMAPVIVPTIAPPIHIHYYTLIRYEFRLSLASKGEYLGGYQYLQLSYYSEVWEQYQV